MDFAWSDEQEALRQAIDRFAREELNGSLIENDRDGVFNHAGWRKCGDFGMMGLPVPADYGGHGADALTTVGALERLGYACQDNGLIFSINAHMWTASMPLVAFGTQGQKEKYLPGLCTGGLIGGNATSEPEAGSDVYSLCTSAEKQSDRYVLNGEKTYSTNGPIADVIVVYATVDKSKGSQGITAFLVDKGTPGLTIVRTLEKMGLRTSPMAEIRFDDCEVPETNRLGKEGMGTAIFNDSMNWERSCIMASAVGSMQRLLETCLRYAKTRKQFGQSIGKFQLVSTKIVDMKLRLETARQLLYHSAWLRKRGKTAILESAMTKLHVSDCWIKSCEDAMQIHGAAGYMTEYGIERELRDALASKFYSGTNEIQRTIIAALLGL